MNPEPPTPLEYATPNDDRGRSRRNYGGCLIPLGIFVAAVGILFWRAADPLSSRERENALISLVMFSGVAFGLIVAGWFMRKSD